MNRPQQLFSVLLVIIFSMTTIRPAFCQSDSSKPTTLGLIAASVAPAVVIGTSFGQNYYDFWRNSKKVPFYFSTDPPYSLHSDKMGHAMYAYVSANITKLCFIEAGVSPLTAAWIGFGTSFAAQTIVEIGDGVHAYQPYFGFSPGDEIADFLGAFFPVAKEYVPYLNRFDYKFGIYPSDAYYQGAFRGVLDDNESQFFWLSMDIHDYLFNGYPPWLNIAVGYGVADLPSSAFLKNRNELTPKSLAYLGFDINLKNLPIEGKAWKIIAEVLSHYHIPFPALQFAPIVKWKWIQY